MFTQPESRRSPAWATDIGADSVRVNHSTRDSLRARAAASFPLRQDRRSAFRESQHRCRCLPSQDLDCSWTRTASIKSNMAQWDI